MKTNGSGGTSRTRFLWILPPLLVAAAIVASLLALPYLPDRMPTHWGMDGQPTSSMPRGFAVGIIPGTMVWIGFLVSVLAWSASTTREGSPLPEWFAPGISAVTLGFMLALHLALLGVGLGWPVSMPAVVNVATGAMLIVFGRMTPHVPRNHIFGVRTARSLRSPEAWDRANRVGGRWMVVGGVITILAAPLPGAWPLIVLLSAMIGSCAITLFADRIEGPSTTD